MKRRLTWNRGIETNILRNYHLATPSDIDAGLHWYQSARDQVDIIATRWGVLPYQVAGVIAALSPGCEWGRNVIDSESLISAHVSGRDIPSVGVYGSRNTEKALRILRGELPTDVLGGKKVRAFFYNILFPLGEELVTIDRHAKALAINAPSERAGFASNDKLSLVSPGEYDYLAWHYRVIARRFGLVPSQFQAINWVTWKRRNEARDEEIPF